jgi:hypothetical protein
LLGESAVLPGQVPQRPLVSLAGLLVSLVILSTGVIGIDSSRAALRPATPLSEIARPAVPNPLDELVQRARAFDSRDRRDHPSHLRPVAVPRSTPPAAHEPSPRAESASLGELAGSLRRQVRDALAQTPEAPRPETDVPPPIRPALQSTFDGPAVLPAPIRRVKPVLPPRTVALFGEQTFDLIYSVDALGRPVDIRLGDRLVPEVFVDAAVDALRQWRFPPVDASLRDQRIRQTFVFTRPLREPSRCTTGTRLCGRGAGHIEQLVVNARD